MKRESIPGAGFMNAREKQAPAPAYLPAMTRGSLIDSCLFALDCHKLAAEDRQLIREALRRLALILGVLGREAE